jgi:hypothetical protein
MNTLPTLLGHLDEFPLDEFQRKYVVYSEVKLPRSET